MGCETTKPDHLIRVMRLGYEMLHFTNQAAPRALARRLHGETMSKALLAAAAAVTVALAGCAPPQSADCARALSQAAEAQCQQRQQAETQQQQEDELWRATAIGGGSG
jgi:ribosomal protein L12E/L44/L45/RPP1/RPP2